LKIQSRESEVWVEEWVPWEGRDQGRDTKLTTSWTPGQVPEREGYLSMCWTKTNWTPCAGSRWGSEEEAHLTRCLSMGCVSFGLTRIASMDFEVLIGWRWCYLDQGVKGCADVNDLCREHWIWDLSKWCLIKKIGSGLIRDVLTIIFLGPD
jgi:hypothetical protein